MVNSTVGLLARVRAGTMFSSTMFSSTMLRSAAVVSGGAAVGQLAVAAASPILSRWFAPESFGTLGAFLGFATLLGACGCLRFELAVQAATTDEEAEDVARLAFRTLLVTALLTLFVVFLLGATGAGAGNSSSGLGSALWLLPPTILSIGTFNLGIFWAVRRGWFGSVAKARVVLGVGTVVPQLVAGFLGFGLLGLLLGPLVGWGLAAIILLVSARFNPTLRPQESSATLARRYKRFPLISIWSALFKRGALEVPAIMLLAFFDERAAGLFYLCNRALIVPANVIAEGVYQSFLNQAGELARADARALRSLTVATVCTLALLVVGPIVVAMFIVPPLIPIVFGSAWSDAGPLALRLLPMVGTLLIAVPVSSQLWLLGRQDLELVRDALRFLAVLAVFAIAGVADWGLLTTMTAYSFVMAAGYLATLGLVLYATTQNVHSAKKLHAMAVPNRQTAGSIDSGVR